MTQSIVLRRVLLALVAVAAIGGSSALPTQAAAQACRATNWGFVSTTFSNGQKHSAVQHVEFQSACANPVVIADAYTHTVPCGSANGPTLCSNDGNSTVQDVHASVTNITSAGFDVFLSATNGVWVGSSNPTHFIGYQVMCGDQSLPTCSSQKTVGGIANVTFSSGTKKSTVQHLSLPNNCQSPVVVAQSLKDTLPCAGGACQNDPSNTSTALHAVVTNVSNGFFDLFLTSMNNVETTGANPAGSIAYSVMCSNEVASAKSVLGGTTTVSFSNGQAKSTVQHVTFPMTCQNAAVNAQSYTDEVKCGSANGPTLCQNDPTNVNQDIQPTVLNVTSQGFDVFLSGANGTWVGTGNGAHTVAWSAVCETQGTSVSSTTSSTPASSSSSVASSVASSSTPSSVASSSISSTTSSVHSSSSVMSSSSSSMSTAPGTGCVEAIMETRNANNTVMTPVVQFSFSVANQTLTNGGNGRVTFLNITPGTYHLTSPLPSGWTRVSVSPNDGFVTIAAGSNCATVHFVNKQISFQSSSSSARPACDDNIDNDNDGKADYPADKGCYGYSDNDEWNSGNVDKPECDDNQDNDRDGKYDYPADKGCHGYSDDNEENDDDDDEMQCDDGRDNDHDGDIDYPEDRGCSSRHDDNERDSGGNGGHKDKDFVLIKEASASEVFPNGEIEYTLTIENETGDDLYDVEIVDDYPEEDVNITDDDNADDDDGDTLTWTIGRLDDGDSETITYRVSLRSGVRAGDIIVNEAIAYAGDLEAEAEAEVSVIGNLPQTGGRGLNGGSAFLRPISSATSTDGSALPLIIWSLTALTGIGGGAFLGRKYFL